MNIQNINPVNIYNNVSWNSSAKTPRFISFTSAKDISLQYVLEKHSKFLPERIIEEIKKLLASGKKELPQLWELHNQVYEPLMNAKSLEEVKSLYPELKDVQDMTILSKNRSKAVKAVRERMPLENFTLEYLKRIYSPKNQESIVKEFGFTMRSLLNWLNSKLNIKKLSGNYLNLIRMSNEEENNRIAECSRQAIYANPELQAQRQAKVTEHHRTPEYRAKKSKESKAFYARCPEHRDKVGLISQRTWDKCPEVKAALSAYTAQCSNFVRSALSKKRLGQQLSETERKAIGGYYQYFWDNNPVHKATYKRCRREAIKELKAEHLIY